ncbi:MAG: hypothetical protein AUJ75_02690 [Candidatus Omnitrophica bacterium CG1_02_49_10]|nr:MAG: hypothetical protein AUJ75_02690 [Candidatus Omnitrophica bacterium CG1_02_49_10]
MKFKRHLTLKKDELNIAPLVDVVFLLLIFFMLTSSFIFQPGIKINLPKAITSEVLQQQSLIITITADSQVYLNDRRISDEDLYIEMKESAKSSGPLLIKADRSASVGKVVEIWDMCRDAGITQIHIATSQAKK